MQLTIDVEYDYDFKLYGILSPLKEHVLAWNIEKKIEIKFQTKEEFPLLLLKGNLLFSSYSYEEDYGYLRIIKNKSWETKNKQPYLIPELKQFDFLLMLNGSIKDTEQEETISKLKQISNILLIQSLEIESLKSKRKFDF